jgi:hypothetical protein
MTLDAPSRVTASGVWAETLERVAKLGNGYQLEIAPVEGDWIAADQVVKGGPDFDRVAAILERDCDAVARRAAGSQFVLEYLRFAWPAITAFALERRVPDVAAENLLVRIDERGTPVAFALAEARFAVLSGDPAAPHAAFVARTTRSS